MLKPGRLILLLVGAAALPYLVSNGSSIRDIGFKAFPASGEHSSTDPHETAHLDPHHPANGQAAAGHPAFPIPQTPTGAEIRPLSEAFRFDVTTAWVLGHWSRVSTSLADIDLQGYRVSLVTGTSEGDVAGALTYYFNPQQRVAKITFEGKTGDARWLVDFLVRQHGFTRTLTSDPGLYLYQVKDGAKVISEMRIKSAAVVRAEDPHGRFDVSLSMTRPKG
jgi:hypothetical protein